MLRGKRYIVIFLVAILPAFSFEASSQNSIVHQVRDAIKTGSSKELTKHLHHTIDITLEDNMGSYSRNQAEFVLKDFFKKYPPSSFTIVHQGASKGGLQFAIGQYLSDGNTFRVWMRIKNAEAAGMIHELSFIKE